ncbi:MAG TPA: DNA-protecting protein DprA [Candidatus Omnitrophica bacterium]|nr:MAG: DNA protecting protein DprA [Omnitrophica WOR_2 bacterium GWA2_45_18]HBR15163.1 DNA-protecting protein DprA [Candidatus Omnitrophota bacterium]
MTELDALLVLNAVAGVGNIRVRKLVEQYGSAHKLFSLDEAELRENGVPQPAVQNILNFPRDNFLKNEYNLITQKKVKLVDYRDESYPVNLRGIPDAPIVLYVRGSILKDNEASIAIVGSRRCSLYGSSVSGQFAGRLAELGFCVVSGLARGIDTAAHQGALKAKGQTQAVMGCGLAQIYPPENKNLFEEISEKGAVISEFSMETPPAPYNFPRRNRVISGLSWGVVVVEAALRSGALITADCALEQGRDVFAVPGKVDNPGSWGAHNLIKQGAKLVSSVEDILEELELPLTRFLEERKARAGQDIPQDKELPNLMPSNPFVTSAAHGNCLEALPSEGELTEEENAVYRHLSDSPVHVDELSLRCARPAAFIGSVLLQLELKRVVKQLPGKLFVK